MQLTWLGHSSVLVETGGARVLADPLLRPRVGALRRIAALPDLDGLGLSPVDELDAVVISHLHHDHCDLPTLRRLRCRHLLVPPGAGDYLRQHGVAGAVEVPPGSSVSVTDTVSITVVPADHHGRREPWGPTAQAVGHLVESGTTTTWLAGDTGLFDGMARLATFGRRGVIDVAAIPVWGWGPNLGPGHLDPDQAVEAALRVGARCVVPVHWGTFHPAFMRRTMTSQLTQPGPRFVSAVEGAANGTQAHLLDVGACLRA